MRKSLLCLLLLFTSPFALAAKPVNPAVTTLKLSGDFQQMGQQYADALGPVLLQQLALAKQRFGSPSEQPLLQMLYQNLVDEIIDVASLRYDPELFAFIEGEANSEFAQSHGLTVRDFIYLDQALPISSLQHEFFHSIMPLFADNPKPQPMGNCSFIGVMHDGVTVGRNYDWLNGHMDAFTRFPVVTIFDHQDKQNFPHQVMSVANAGNFSSITLMNDRGLFIAINSGHSAVGSYQVWHRASYFAQMMKLMFSANSFDDMQSWIETTSPDYGYIVNIAGPGDNELRSYEVAPYDELQGQYDDRGSDNLVPYNVFTVKSREAKADNITTPELDSNEHYLVATNIYRVQQWAAHLGHEPVQQTPTFSKQRHENLLQQAQHYQADFLAEEVDSMQLMREIMQATLDDDDNANKGATAVLCKTDPLFATNPDSTLYSVVFNTKQKRLSVRYQQTDNAQAVCESQWTAWQDVQLGDEMD